jgi:putative acetyltransferase
MAVTARPEQPGDEDAIDEVVAAAFEREFGSTAEVALVRNLRDRGELVDDLTLVAEVDGRVVGHVAFSEVTLDGRPARGLGLGPVAVAPDDQRAGIGTRLIETALERAAADGWQFVAVLGHPTYYPRFGFVPAAPLGITGDFGDDDAWMVRPLGDHPLPSGHVRFAPAFAD